MNHISLIALALTLLLGGGEAALAQSGEVVSYNANGSKLAQALTAAFQKKYPNIKVETIVGGSGELLARVKGEKDHPRGDVYNGSMETLVSSPELFMATKTAEHDKFTDMAYGKNNLYYGDSLSLQVVMVNTEMMSLADAPKCWKDLADPKYKGKIVMANPSLSGSAYSQLAQLIQLYGWGIAEKVINNSIFVPKSRLVYTNVSRGEAPIGITEETKPYKEAAKGFPVKTVYFCEGTGMRYGAIAMIKGGPNPKNGKLYYDFMNSKKGHEIGVKVRKRRSPRHDVSVPKGLPPLSEVKLFAYDGLTAASSRDAYLKKFNEIFSRK